MPTLEEWDPRPCIVKWLRQQDHGKKTTEKAHVQRRFQGVFKEVSCENEEPGDAQESRATEKESKTVFIFGTHTVLYLYLSVVKIWFILQKYVAILCAMEIKVKTPTSSYFHFQLNKWSLSRVEK